MDIKQAISVLENEVLPVFSYDQTATGENVQEIIKLLKILEEIINTQKRNYRKSSVCAGCGKRKTSVCLW